MAYLFTVSDLAGNTLSELPGATSKKFTRALLSMSTAEVKVPVYDEIADFLLQGDALLKVVDVISPFQRVNLFHGRLTTAEEVADENGGSVACTFADAFWTLVRRLIGKSATGYSYGTAASLQAATAMISDILATVNAEGSTGMRLGSVTASPADQYLGPVYYAKAAQIITQLSAVLNGPDWRIDPIDAIPLGSNAALATYCELVMAPTLGQVNSGQPFEFGDGRLNVKSYKRAVSNEGTADQLFNLPAGFPDTTAGSVVSAVDNAAIASRGILEDVISTDLTNNQLRQKLVNLHAQIRSGARTTITFDPVNDLNFQRVPRLRTDYDVGDVHPFRATITRNENGVSVVDKRIDILSRIYQVSVSVDEKGVGTPSITATPS